MKCHDDNTIILQNLQRGSNMSAQFSLKRLPAVVFICLYVLTLLVAPASAVLVATDTINTHPVMLDSSGTIISWVPQQDQAYTTVVANAWNYLLNTVPTDPTNQKPDYYSYSYLNPDTQQSVGWPHNPAGLYSMFIESAMEWYQFSGDARVLQFARNVAD